MPPVMGAVAFMMAEFMGVSYAQIAMAAAIPAFLYYFAIYATVHFEASRLRLRGIPEDLLPKPWPLMKQEGYLYCHWQRLLLLFCWVTRLYWWLFGRS